MWLAEPASMVRDASVDKTLGSDGWLFGGPEVGLTLPSLLVDASMDALA
jgi:hypothetical protein